MTKNATSGTFNFSPSGWLNGNYNSSLNPVVYNFTALRFPINTATSADIRLVIATSADATGLRDNHTIIWRVKHEQQTGYYATNWFSGSDGSWPGNAFEYGTHPYPCDGTYDGGSGIAANPTYGSGTDHYMEIAGLGAADFIQGPGDPTQRVTDVWYTQVKQCWRSGGNLIHRFYPDYANHPTRYIEKSISEASFDAVTPAEPRMYFGGSLWTGGSGTNSETLAGDLYGIRVFGNGQMSTGDISSEISSLGSNTPSTSTGTSAVFYINDSPSTNDITDKSGQGHNASWHNQYKASTVDV